jgi:hypothetical protein
MYFRPVKECIELHIKTWYYDSVRIWAEGLDPFLLAGIGDAGVVGGREKLPEGLK